MPTQLTLERQPEYQYAWAITGEVVAHPYIKKNLDFILYGCPRLYFPWIQILNKLIRALTSPTNVDHWEDIIGYATLARDHLTKVEEEVADDPV